MSRERYKNKKWTHQTKRSNASIFVLREEKGGRGVGTPLVLDSNCCCISHQKSFPPFPQGMEN